MKIAGLGFCFRCNEIAKCTYSGGDSNHQEEHLCLSCYFHEHPKKALFIQHGGETFKVVDKSGTMHKMMAQTKDSQ